MNTERIDTGQISHTDSSTSPSEGRRWEVKFKRIRAAIIKEGKYEMTKYNIIRKRVKSHPKGQQSKIITQFKLNKINM